MQNAGNLYRCLLKFSCTITVNKSIFKQSETSTQYVLLVCLWSGWQDLNLRPPAPHAGAIPGYATSRSVHIFYNIPS